MPGLRRSRLIGTACLVILVPLLAGSCAGDEQPAAEEPVPTATTTVRVTVTAEAPSEEIETAAAVPPALRTPTFQMPSRNIGCAVSARFLRCDILSGLNPEPKTACELDWTGLVLGPTGSPEPNCAGDTAYDEQAPVLPYGGSWRRGGITCDSRKTGLRCTNAGGRGFSLARASWETF